MKQENTPFHVILLAGGLGTRMKATIPKQYLPLQNRPLALYSFELFLRLPEVIEIVIVCDPAYHNIFQMHCSEFAKISFAPPGKRRQDSVFNGLQKISSDSLICIHDAARPFIHPDLVYRVVSAASKWGAAALGIPTKGTIKVCDDAQFVVDTLDRSRLWEIQTPQAARLDLLQKGFSQAQLKDLTVTDDVSLVELIDHPVKIVEGSHTNLKVTTSDDVLLAEYLLEKHVCLQVNHCL